ncbi:hypothetical protein F5Y12DRAFT_297840 [Xylaria sp. FL1777]|nr:hypothetical protein F5Y12DRAFT_297840 [Xylaria sp. FL1777]
MQVRQEEASLLIGGSLTIELLPDILILHQYCIIRTTALKMLTVSSILWAHLPVCLVPLLVLHTKSGNKRAASRTRLNPMRFNPTCSSRKPRSSLGCVVHQALSKVPILC